ncbi:citrate lyase beta like protein [Reticulomyxa filosa]|uniref:Citrate lyase beta like protein n=1 Tax=Reticulomyxa filosa TaxID=46433 RepID=X6LUR4_RETFI|nr:citrate lyase beta like protein [Reticulomyxa filosa]|eukprot:ETO05678.1 citrate lyase beta like protein [Reticulomyxa filosa]
MCALTYLSVDSAHSICKASSRLSAIIFGGDDFAAALGAVRTPTNHELWFARNQVLLHSKANELQCIDIVNIHLKDEQRFERECKEGFEMGFDGKQPVAQKLFSPPKEKIEWAQKVVTKFEKEISAGVGAFEMDGTMIDMPTVKQAQHLVQRAKVFFQKHQKFIHIRLLYLQLNSKFHKQKINLFEQITAITITICCHARYFNQMRNEMTTDRSSVQMIVIYSKKTQTHFCCLYLNFLKYVYILGMNKKKLREARATTNKVKNDIYKLKNNGFVVKWMNR